MTTSEKIENCKLAGCKYDMLSDTRKVKILECQNMDQMFKIISDFINEDVKSFMTENSKTIAKNITK